MLLLAGVAVVPCVAMCALSSAYFVRNYYNILKTINILSIVDVHNLALLRGLAVHRF